MSNTKIYHIIHIDRLKSVINDGCLWSDKLARKKKCEGTTREKQAEFLIENDFPWELIEKIGTYSGKRKSEVDEIIDIATRKPLVAKDRNIDSIALPALGCGLGGLDWNNVKHLVQRILSPLNDVKITVLEPR